MFIGLFDALLELIIPAVSNSGDDVRDEVQSMRRLLDVALRQALETL